jgi:hypothetical protein
LNGPQIQNDLYGAKSQTPVTFYNEIPAPLLKTALEKFGKGNKEKQQNIVQAIWVLLFGEGTTTTTTTTTKSPMNPMNPMNPNGMNKTSSADDTLNKAAMFNSSLIMRARRPTKFKIEGNCKNPPKKHKDSEYVDE